MTTAWLRRLPHTMLPMICAAASTLSAQDVSWSFVGRLEGGNIPWVCSIGTNDVLAQTDTRGLFRSTDGGASWHPFLPDSLLSARFLGGGNGHPLFLFHNYKTYRSTDAGASWTQLSPQIGGQLIYGMPGGALFASLDGAIWRSVDRGESWSRIIYTGLGRNATFTSGPDGSIYAAFIRAGSSVGEDAAGIWKSTDDGTTWSSLAIGDLLEDATGFTVTPRGTMFIVNQRTGLHRSTDNGATWKRILPSMDNAAVAATGSQMIVTDHQNVYFSSDEGATWSEQTCVATNLTSGIIVGNSVLVGTVGHGVLKLSASSEPRPANEGIDALGFNSIWTGADGSLMGSAADLVYRSTDGGDHWTAFSLGRSQAEMSQVTTGGARLRFPQGQNGILRSLDNGYSWGQVYYAPIPMASGPVATGPNHDAYAIVPPDRIIRSTDDGATWLNFAFTQPTTDYQSGNLMVDGDRLLVATESGRVVEFDTATGIRRGETMVNPRGVSQLLRSPSGHLFARSSLGGINRSTDNGVTWESISPVPGNNREYVQIAFGPGGRMAVSTDIGIFLSSDEGASWLLEPRGLPPLDRITGEGPLYSVAFGPDGAVYAASTAGGLYRGMLPAGAAVAGEAVAGGVSIDAVSPNPTSGSTSLRLRLDRDARVRVRLVDAIGRDAIDSRALRLGAGTHAVPLDVSGLEAGAYFCTVDVEGVRKTVRLDVVR